MAKISLLLLLVFLLVSYLNHSYQLSKEKKLLESYPGQLVEVKGRLMNIYKLGQGETSLVFLSGGGTPAPILDFMTLADELKNDYQIVIIERFGYGKSDIAASGRDLENVLSESRQALKASQVRGPYILLAHSMAGLEALAWAQTLPEEVKAIVGLDIATPESYEDLAINTPLAYTASYLAKLGLSRYFPGLAENDASRFGHLTEKQKLSIKPCFITEL